MWLRHCFQEQTPVGIAYEKNIVDNLRVGDICVRQQERGGRCGNYPSPFVGNWVNAIENDSIKNLSLHIGGATTHCL